MAPLRLPLVRFAANKPASYTERMRTREKAWSDGDGGEGEWDGRDDGVVVDKDRYLREWAAGGR